MAAMRPGKYECLVCGYIYDPDVGDPVGGIEPGTPFDELPEDWVCPECGAAKDLFEPISFQDLNAGTTDAGQTRMESAPMEQKYECLVCGYIYDPAQGDPQAGVAPGTPFADLPDDWVCPECGAAKDMFEPIA